MDDFLSTCNAISSHSSISLYRHIRKKRYKEDEPRIFLVVNVRDPVARVVSHFGHVKFISKRIGNESVLSFASRTVDSSMFSILALDSC